MRRRGIGVGAASLAAACAIVAAGCGGSSGGPVTLNLLGPLDPGGTNTKAAKECSDQSGGKYVIKQSPVANSADASRELIVRRLAAGDKNIDIINMDTIWTPEFAEAGWLRELKGAEQEDALDDVLDGPKASVQWKDKTYAIPLNTNVQLLWYRKDLVPEPPETWDEMIEMAKKLPAGEGNILEQGQKYEGYVVWFNNLVASAGGRSSTPRARPTLDDAAVKAAQIIKDVAHVRPLRPVAVDRAGGPGPARLRGGQGRLPAQLAVRLRRRARGRRDQRRHEEGLREHGLRPLARRQQGRAEQGLDRRRQPRHPEDGPEPRRSRPRPRCA